MSEPVTCIQKPALTAHTPGPWRSTEEYGAAPGMPLHFCHCLIRNDNDDWIASTWADNPNALADAALIAQAPALLAQAPALLAHAEKSLNWLIGERDCHYDGCSTSDGHVLDKNDRHILASYDRDIDELRALIAACKGAA